MVMLNAGELIALLSQEGSVIAFFAMTRGVVPKRNVSECILNEYAHDLDCCLDRAALLTQEGSLGCAPSAGEIFPGISSDFSA